MSENVSDPLNEDQYVTTTSHEDYTCPYCNGSGLQSSYDSVEPCWYCGGSGRVS